MPSTFRSTKLKVANFIADIRIINSDKR